jgi:uncharacterized membrane protein YeaQ/YmgE (transglycosylase-associated protein family)
MYLIIELAICVLAGWATGKLMKGSGYGVLADLLLGLVGGLLGGLLLGSLALGGGILGDFLIRVIGAVVLVALVRLIKKS